MSRNIYGARWIQGRVNSGAMTAEGALAIALPTAAQLRQSALCGTVLIGKDARRSGYMLKSALAEGFTSMGMGVLLTGPLPSPAPGIPAGAIRAAAL